MKITAIRAAVEHIKPARAADAYAGQESLTFVRCRVETDSGVHGEGVTGRFFAERILPETAAQLARISAGAGGVMELPDEQF